MTEQVFTLSNRSIPIEDSKTKSSDSYQQNFNSNSQDSDDIQSAPKKVDTIYYDNIIKDLVSKIDNLMEEKSYIQEECDSMSRQLLEKEAFIGKLNEELVSEKLGNDTSRIITSQKDFYNSFSSPNKSSLNISKSYNNNSAFINKEVYMDNQMDLHQSDMDYYENVINELAAKIDVLNEEKNVMQIMNDTLSEKLEEKDEIISKLNTRLLQNQNRSPSAIDNSKPISESFLGIDSAIKVSTPDEFGVSFLEEDNDSIDFLISTGPQSTTSASNLDNIAERYNLRLSTYQSSNESFFQKDFSVDELKYIITQREQQVYS